MRKFKEEPLSKLKEFIDEMIWKIKPKPKYKLTPYGMAIGKFLDEHKDEYNSLEECYQAFKKQYNTMWGIKE